MKAELVVNARSTLGEAPFWDESTKRLHWVDIMEKRICTFHPGNGSSRYIQLDQYVGAVVPRTGGGWTAVLKGGFYHIDRNGYSTFIVNPERDKPDNRFNDGKCDPAGRFWAGTMSLSNRKKAGSLFRLDPDGSVRRMLENVTISNGLAWSGDGDIFYFIDTPTRKVVAFDYDIKTGEIHNARTVINIPPEEGDPDGMTIDQEGKLWIAHWGGWQVARWNPFTGKKLDSIPLPVSLVTSCTFGGKNMNELFITTAKIGLREDELQEQPLSGGLFRIKLNVKGYPVHRFKG